MTAPVPCGHLYIPPGDPIAERLEIGAVALRYAALGLPVISLLPGTKRPATPHGVHDGTTAPAVITRWWTEDQCRGVGIVTWQLLVLDFDRKHGFDGAASFGAWLTASGLVLPEGPWAGTPSGGAHLYLRMPAGRTVQSRSGVLPGVDIRGAGGYVAAWPTGIRMTALRRPGDPRESGAVFGTYTWHGCPCQMPEAPAALLDALDQLPGTGHGGPGAGRRGGRGMLPPTEELLATGLPPGSRNDVMYDLACRLWREHGQAAWPVVEDVCHRVWLATGQGSEPFPWSEAKPRIGYAKSWAARQDAADAELARQFALAMSGRRP